MSAKHNPNTSHGDNIERLQQHANAKGTCAFGSDWHSCGYDVRDDEKQTQAPNHYHCNSGSRDVVVASAEASIVLVVVTQILVESLFNSRDNRFV